MRNLVLKNMNLMNAFDELMGPVIAGHVMDFKVHVVEKDDEYNMSVELPGVNKEDVKLDFTPEGLLVIDVEKKVQKEESQGRVVYSEIKEFKSQRSFNFKGLIDLNKIKAKFENGVLNVSLGKLNKQQSPTKIEIN